MDYFVPSDPIGTKCDPTGRVCSDCVAGYFVNKDNVCEKDCGAGTYKDEAQKTCLGCPSTTCNECAKEGCKSCSDSKALFRNDDKAGIIECTARCPRGTRKMLQEPDNIYRCVGCLTTHCSDCSISFSLCKACITEKVLTLDNQCSDQCGVKESEIPNTAYHGKKCISCAKFGPQCLKCDTEKCVDCGNDGHFTHPDGLCREGCPTGYSIVPKSSPKVCKKCAVHNCKNN